MVSHRFLLLIAATIFLISNQTLGFVTPKAFQCRLQRDATSSIPECSRFSEATQHFAKPDDEEQKEQVQVGSKEYYEGFISRDLAEDSERVTGDAVLNPTFKFVGGVSIVIVVLLIAFLFSNGLI